MILPTPVFIKKHPIFCLTVTIFVLLICVGIYQTHKPLPDGLSFEGLLHPVKNIQFYRDLTWIDPAGKRQTDHEIFDQALTMIKNARHFILLDMFLFNDFSGTRTLINRPVSGEIVDALIKQNQNYPDISIIVITDPINTVYGGMANPLFDRLNAHHIPVIYTRLELLRDSNPIYSSFWRIFIQPFGNTKASLIPNPFGDGRVSIRSYLKMFNFKANHRKIIITDKGDDYIAMISSANPHDASSFHGNMAVTFTGPAVKDLIHAERAVLEFSGARMPPEVDIPDHDNHSTTRIKVITENKIKHAVLSALNKATHNDRIFLVMFYLSDRQILQSLKSAHQRGAQIQILLDPNKDAFGYTKNGIPNRQTAAELIQSGISVKWSETHGEQAHAKMLLIDYADGRSTLIAGSANYTRRNLDDFNLEADIAVYGSSRDDVFIDARECGMLLWNNSERQTFSVNYQKYADNSRLRIFLYRLIEATGMCTF